MKTLFYVFLTLGLSLLSCSNTFAQVGGEGRMGNGEGYWILGLNAGGAWQDSDVDARLGGGWGFYLGHSIYNRPNSFFSADLRFRYMNTYTFGQNHRDTLFGNMTLADPSQFSYRPDSLPFAHNHSTTFHDLSLELRINFEELRRKTNVWLSIYGGIGLGIYGSKFDQKDISGLDYDYESIDFTQADRDVCRDIITLRDEDYETNAFSDGFGDNLFQLTFTPSVGFELGYWFTPSFALGIGHRVTFTLQDNFEGVEINNGEAINGSIHHYTAFLLHWRITGGKRKVKCPEVEFELPVNNGQTYTTNRSSVFVKAKVSNVNQSQISYTINGQGYSNFTYDEQTDVFQSDAQLQEGENRIVIQGTNDCGTDGQHIIVIYDPNKVPVPPVVTITNPATSPTNTKVQRTTISAEILHVSNRNNVTFTVNGQVSNNFNFSGTSFQSNTITLQEGQNTITVKGTNADGSDSKTVVINYERDIPPPVVTITSPTQNPHTVSTPTVNLAATILNVVGKQNVTFVVNGQNSSNFSFSGTSFYANNISLNEGSNILTVTGQNAKGQDTKTTVVIYKKEVLLPVVNITRPTANPYRTNITTATINATILNVIGRQNVTFTVNGQANNNFNFSGTSFSANINLVAGNNTVTITGRNEAGQDSKTTLLIYEKQVPQPIVTITNPSSNPYTTQNATATVNATIQHVDSRNDVTCTVNGQLNNSFSFSGINFSLNNLSLAAGNNTITITGRNSAGQDTKSTLIIYNKIVEQPPVVTINYPNQNPFTTANSSVSINATILNVASKNNVTFTVNGSNQTNFNFVGTSFTAGKIGLQPGNNTITITGSNSAGQDSKTTVVIYREPVLLEPSVVITYPNQNPFTSTASSVNLVAVINNVASKNDVTFTANGQNLTNFNFSGTSFTANNINLKTGNNTFVISGRNASGQASASTIVIYNPVQQPEVTITYPNQNPFNTTVANTNITATIKNVASKNDVTFTVNGQVNANFSFSGTSFTANNVALQSGTTTFTITGRNSTGQDTKSTVVIYSKPVQEPQVIITYPNQNPFNTTVANTNITATIKNVATKGDVTFTVNGQVNANFSFSGTSFTANNVSLQAGTTTFTISGRNSAGQDTKSTVVIYRKPVQEPQVIITYPNQNPFNTNVASTNITATIKNVASKNDVTFTVNGQVNTNFSFSGTSFTANNVALQSGTTTFTISGRNSAGQDTKSTVVIYRKPVQEPQVIITYPNQNPFNTTVANTNITATIKNVATKGDVTFTVNGQANTNFSFSGTSFTANNIALQAGATTFTISGRNSAGQDTKSTVVVYTKPVEKPVVTITVPNQNPLTTTNATVNILAIIKNVPNKSGVTFTVNGQVNTNFSFSGTSFTANNVALQSGTTTFTITGRNSAGQDTKSTVVIYRKPVQEPQVIITYPNQNPFNTTVANTNITATIKNVATKGDVTFTVNGQANTNFSFSGTSFTANNIALQAGATTFTISGRNSAGQDTKSTVVVYTKPVEKPVVTITVPNQNPFTTTNAAVNILAIIKNVPNKSGVTFTVNGQVNNNFSFSGTSFTANDLALTLGANTFTITGRNSAGQDTKTTVVMYRKPIAPPIVTIIYPTQNPLTIPSNKVNFSANVQNVATASGITFTVNGQNYTAFSYGKGSVTANGITLNEGANTFTLTGRNKAGQDTKSTVVIYKKVVPKPLVTITNPTQNPTTVTNNKANITATIKNVASKNDVIFTVNGQPNTAFSFSGTSFVANNVSLVAGNNTFVITGKNSAGQNSKTTAIIYEPQLPPVVNFVVPNTNPFNTAAASMKIVSATVKNVTNKNQITFTVNGVVNNNFSFSGINFTANNISLNPDSNVLVIQAVNPGGTTSASTLVIRTSGININNSGSSNSSGIGVQNQTGGGSSDETGGGTGGNGKKTTGTQNDPKGGTKNQQGGSRGGGQVSPAPAPNKGRTPK